jgi:oligopeptide/dipeptide ABC transporter ATP-binding protein
LLKAAPTMYKSEGSLVTIAGAVPNLSRPPPGCRFHPRCPIARPICRVEPAPRLDPVAGSPNHRSACHFASEVPNLP